MTARWIQVEINSGPNGIVNFPIREDNSVSLSTIDRVVPGIALLKYRDIHSNSWYMYVNFLYIAVTLDLFSFLLIVLVSILFIVVFVQLMEIHGIMMSFMYQCSLMVSVL
jgi:hypothetical protein